MIIKKNKILKQIQKNSKYKNKINYYLQYPQSHLYLIYIQLFYQNKKKFNKNIIKLLIKKY